MSTLAEQLKGKFEEVHPAKKLRTVRWLETCFLAISFEFQDAPHFRSTSMFFVETESFCSTLQRIVLNVFLEVTKQIPRCIFLASLPLTKRLHGTDARFKGLICDSAHAGQLTSRVFMMSVPENIVW